MRAALSAKAPRGHARARPVMLPSPAGGINGVDPIGAMPAGDAVDLDNFVPIDGGVETREGCAVLHDLGTAARVGSLHRFDEASAAELVASSGGRLFAVNALAFSQLALGFAGDRWRAANHANRLFLVNGADAPQTVTRAAGGLAVSASGWTGPADIAKLHEVKSHANRLFFAEKGSASFWYADLQAVTGALTEFRLDSIGAGGGTLERIETLAPDGGDGGADDMIAFFMSSGDVVLYRGSNPGDAANWQLAGVFSAARPIAAAKFAGDVVTVSTDGYGALSRLLPSGRSPVAGFGAKLGRVATEAASQFGRNSGWQILYHPARRFLLVHVPQTASRAEQHVMNMTTGAWGRFSGLPASAWGHLGDTLVLGTFDGRICAYGGASDDGAPIVCTAQCAWNRLGLAAKKRINMVRPFVASTATPIVRHVIGADFRRPVFGAAAALEPHPDVGVWDKSVWDEAVWGGSERITRDWRGGGVIGDYIGVGLRADTRAGRVRWLATSLLVEAGGVL